MLIRWRQAHGVVLDTQVGFLTVNVDQSIMPWGMMI